MSIFPHEIPRTLLSGPDELARAFAEPVELDSHRSLAAARMAILDENFADQVAAYLESTHYDPNIRGRLKRHVTQIFNVGHDVTRALACVYKSGVRRSVGTKTQDKALAKLNEATHFGTLAPMLNRVGWFVGPALEVPAIRGKRVVREIIPASKHLVMVDPEDPCGPPIAAAWAWPWKGKQRIVVLDQEAWRYYDWNAVEKRLKAAGTVPHGIVDANGEPLFPGTHWRFDVCTDPDDYFSKRRHNRVLEATVKAAGIASIMDMVRKSQNRKQVALFGNLDRLASHTKFDPEKPLMMQVAEDDPLPMFDVKDLNTSVEFFRDHIMLYYRTVVEAFGIPQSELTFDAETESTLGGMELKHERLSQLRNEQIPFAREAELSSQYKLVATVLQQKDHPLAKGLPPLPKMAEKLEIEFPELNRVEDPSKLKLLSDHELQRGQTTDAHLYQRRHPHLTLDECHEAVMANLEKQAEYNEFKASRGLDPAAPMEDPQQSTGRIGGQAPNPNRKSLDNDERGERGRANPSSQR